METVQLNKSHVYFAFKGENFDPQDISLALGLEPSNSWKKGDKGKYQPIMDSSYWELSTIKGNEIIELHILIDSMIANLYPRIDVINRIKNLYQLESFFDVVVDVDLNLDKPVPAFGLNFHTIDFLYLTRSKVDVDIYRFDSSIK